MTKRILILTIFALLIFGCSQNKIAKNLTVEQKMQIANNFFNAEKYRKAILYYQDITYDRNSPLVAEAQMRLAESYFLQEKYLEAQLEFQEVIRLYKNYERLNEAYFNIGVCYYKDSLSPHYTQDETLLAIDSFNTYLEKFPFDENTDKALDYLEKCNYKLLQKKYYNGYTYYKMYDYAAALYYFEQVIELNLNDEIDLKSLYYSAKIYLYRGDKTNALNILNKMNKRYSENDLTIKIKKEVDKL